LRENHLAMKGMNIADISEVLERSEGTYHALIGTVRRSQRTVT